MARFSQRMGITKIKDKMHIDSMDEDLRNSLWNVLLIIFWKPFEKQLFAKIIQEYTDVSLFFELLWHKFFKKTIDSIPYDYYKALDIVKNYFFNAQWYEIYDFIEFAADISKRLDEDYGPLDRLCNDAFKQELSGYRLIADKIVPINSQEEIDEIEQAIDGPIYPVREHLTRSLELFADRYNHDYRNSIKEAISAVESMCISITGDQKATLGTALNMIERSGAIELHRALKNAFSSLYVFTSDADGIRHALLEESNLDYEDAKFMLVSCSAFINYLIVKSDKAGIELS